MYIIRLDLSNNAYRKFGHHFLGDRCHKVPLLEPVVYQELFELHHVTLVQGFLHQGLSLNCHSNVQAPEPEGKTRGGIVTCSVESCNNLLTVCLKLIQMVWMSCSVTFGQRNLAFEITICLQNCWCL